MTPTKNWAKTEPPTAMFTYIENRKTYLLVCGYWASTLWYLSSPLLPCLSSETFFAFWWIFILAPVKALGLEHFSTEKATFFRYPFYIPWEDQIGFKEYRKATLVKNGLTKIRIEGGKLCFCEIVHFLALGFESFINWTPRCFVVNCKPHKLSW